MRFLILLLATLSTASAVLTLLVEPGAMWWETPTRWVLVGLCVMNALLVVRLNATLRALEP